MNSTTQGNLSDVLEGIWQDPQAQIRHLFVLTYKFDAQQFLNLACSKTPEEDFQPGHKDWSKLSILRPLVVCDASAIGEHSGLPPFVEIHPWNHPGFGCHHSKAYCIITDTSVHLALGSFNLTRSGLFHNREVLEHFCWTKGEGAHPQILWRWTAFVRDMYLSRLQDSTASALLSITEALEQHCAALPAEASTPQEECALLTSGYGQSGLDALTALWQRWYGEEQPTNALAVSPFFDMHPVNSCITDDLAKHFPGLRALSIITDETEQSTLCQRHFGRLKGALYRIPVVLDAEEMREIQQRAADRHTSIIDQNITRKLHAKILLLDGPRGGIAYLGSANFTRNAWLGKNCELGVAWRYSADATPQDAIRTHLHVERKNRYATLPKEHPAEARKDEEEASSLWHDLYPKGIAHIVLRSDAAMQQARFQVMPHAEYPLHLKEYVIHWGDVLLGFNELQSQWLPPDQWKRLLLQNRYLRVEPQRQPETTNLLQFWLPFAFDGDIVAQGEALVLSNSQDWLLLHQKDTSVPGYGEQGFNEGETPDAPDDAFEGIGRAQNRVIAMQHTLTLFARVEERYKRLMHSALECPSEEERLHQIKRCFFPLNAFISLLHQELSKQSTDATFKIGELALFLCRLSGELKEREAYTIATDCLLPLLRRLDAILANIPPSISASSEHLRLQYIQFVRKQLAPFLEDA